MINSSPMDNALTKQNIIKKASSDLGNLIVLSGPSGVGKGTVIRKLLTLLPKVIRSTSVTTRPIREGEVEDIDYFYKTKAEFEALIEANAFLEWAQYADNYYGTLKDFVWEKQQLGLDVILEIEVQGAKQVKEIKNDIILIFISPPDFPTLESRLRSRATDSPSSIESRLKTARIELASRLMFDYEVINEDLDEATQDLLHIVKAQRLKIIKG